VAKKILFVDDEPKVLEGLRRMLRPHRHEWDMTFASSGEEALSVLALSQFDVLVTDMRMPGMDGAQLLAEVRGRYPHLVRIILTGQSSREAVLRTIQMAHRQLSKPCDAEVLKATLMRACALSELLTNSTLVTLASRIESVPSLPSLYLEVVQELEGPEPSLQKVGKIIAQDAGMTAKILQIVHSAFFGPRAHVSSVAHAVVALGSETTKMLVLAANIFSKFNQADLHVLAIDALLAHSQATSRLAGLIAKAEQSEQRFIECSCMAGLLHDIGKLLLAGYMPDAYRKVLALAREKDLRPIDAEREILGATHAEVGAYLLGLWGLPDLIVEAVAWHHSPADCPADAFSPLTAVHVANALSHERIAQDAGHAVSVVDTRYLDHLGLAHRIEVWRGL
jgi:putative nucleotidyltransferase with HDIG domain